MGQVGLWGHQTTGGGVGLWGRWTTGGGAGRVVGSPDHWGWGR